jgi:hypothetical protein
LAKNEASIRPTHGGPIKPQPWGATTHQGDTVYLHILDRSEARDGWLTLAGTAEIKLGELKQFLSRDAVQSRLNDAGELEVRIPESADEIDFILTAPFVQ